ncbi:MAG: glycosyltransferase [Patescibacteria group bacterium]|nr:glycosyltransferase [Patescibacteria group bacterium]
MPKVSIIMSTYNNAEFIAKAIESVLVQSFVDFEFIIINDNSNDNAEEIMQSFVDDRIVYLKNQENKGLVFNLNKGIKIAKGEYIARIDSDDWWLDKDKLQKQVDFLDNNLDCALVGTWAKVYNIENKNIFNIVHPTNFAEIKNKMLTKSCFVHSSVLFRKSVSLECGNYDTQEKYVEDYGLWMRMGEKYRLANIGEYGVGYLLNEKGETQKHNLEQVKANLRLIKKHKSFYSNYFLGLLKWLTKYFIVKLGGLKFINKIKMEN